MQQSRAELNFKLSLLRQYGWDKNRISQIPGYNSRLDELQAAILNIKLNKFSMLSEMRRKIAMRYLNELAAIDDIKLPVDTNLSRHSYHLFVIKTNNRDSLRQHLLNNDVATGIHYQELVVDHPGYSKLIKYKENKIINARKTLNYILSLPMYPGLETNSQIKVIKLIKDFYLHRQIKAATA